MKRILIAMLMLISAASYGQSGVDSTLILPTNQQTPMNSKYYKFNKYGSFGQTLSIGGKLFVYDSTFLKGRSYYNILPDPSDSSNQIASTKWVKKWVRDSIGGGGSTQTLQQTLDIGNTLTRNDSINLNTHSLLINGSTVSKLKVNADSTGIISDRGGMLTTQAHSSLGDWAVTGLHSVLDVYDIDQILDYSSNGSSYLNLNIQSGGLYFGDMSSVYTGEKLYMDLGGSYAFFDNITHTSKLGINTTTPTKALDVVGSFKLVDGTQANGYVLTSDGSGNASWQASGGGGSDSSLIAGSHISISYSGTDRIISAIPDTIHYTDLIDSVLTYGLVDSINGLKDTLGGTALTAGVKDVFMNQTLSVKGNVGIGTAANLADALSLNGTYVQSVGASANAFYIANTAAGDDAILLNTTSNTLTIGTGGTPITTNINGDMSVSGVNTLSDLAGTGTRTVLASSTGVLSAPVSDSTTKQFIEPLNYGLETLLKLKPVSFEYKDKFKPQYGSGKQIGFIAQEIQQVLPNSVYQNTAGITKGKIGYNEIDLVPVLVKSVQQLSNEVELLKAEIELLKSKIK